MEALKARILQAHREVERGVFGSEENLHALQAQFRAGKHEIVRDGGTCRLVEPGSSSPRPHRVSMSTLEQAVPRRRPSKPVRTSSSLPYWMLGERETWRL